MASIAPTLEGEASPDFWETVSYKKNGMLISTVIVDFWYNGNSFCLCVA